MTLNQTLWAIVDPLNNRILGDGDAPAIYYEVEDSDIAYVQRHCSRILNGRKAKVVRVRIVEEGEGDFPACPKCGDERECRNCVRQGRA